jgi:hypothetical protein
MQAGDQLVNERSGERAAENDEPAAEDAQRR